MTSADGSSPDPRTLASRKVIAAVLGERVKDHSRAEDSILLPRIEKRGPGIWTKYENAYRDERKLFYGLAKGSRGTMPHM